MDFATEFFYGLLFHRNGPIGLLMSALIGIVFVKTGLTVRYARRAEEKHFPWVTLCCGVITLFLAAWFAFGILHRQDTAIVSSLIFLLPMLFLLGWRNVGISYDDHGFTKRNFLGLGRRFSYDQVTALCAPKKGRTLRIHADGKRIPVDTYMVGLQDFVTLLGEQYITLHDGATLPGLTETILPGRHVKKR